MNSKHIGVVQKCQRCKMKVLEENIASHLDKSKSINISY